MWAARLPKTNLDIRGDRLRYLVALCISEVEDQYRRGLVDKAQSLSAFFSAANGFVGAMTTVGALSVGAISTNDNITDAEAASNVSVVVTCTNFTAGAVITANIDGVTNITQGTVSGGTATVVIPAATATAIANGSHVLNVTGTDAAGIKRTASRSFTRSDT